MWDIYRVISVDVVLVAAVIGDGLVIKHVSAAEVRVALCRREDLRHAVEVEVPLERGSGVAMVVKERVAAGLVFY